MSEVKSKLQEAPHKSAITTLRTQDINPNGKCQNDQYPTLVRNFIT